jgi:putative transposase
VRQQFTQYGKYVGYQEMQKLMRTEEPYKKLMSQSAQCVLQVLDRNWKSFFQGMKGWKKCPDGYLAMPKLPNYRKKGSKFVWFLKNNNTYIKDGKLFFKLKAMQGYGFKTSVKGRLIAVRFVPRNDVFVLEIIYEKETVKNDLDKTSVVAVDFGVNNLVTMTNNVGLNPVIIKGTVVKSINQWYNKEKASLISKLPKEQRQSKRLDRITNRRFQKIKNYFHHTSKYMIDYCINSNIGTLIIGYNKEWKQEINIGKVNNQKFVFIPYNMLLNQLKYKCEMNGIQLVLTEESYTSGTSFLDGELPIKENYNKKRRVKRGLFKTNNGILINSDVNGSFQIMKKVFPDVVYNHGIVGCLNPVSIYSV